MFETKEVEEVSVTEVVRWRTDQHQQSRLLLPPIQRSLVWSNEKIVNYWDSLLRGYPAGLMLVHRAADSRAYDSNNNLKDVQKSDYELFDGQQRMAAILLGYGLGPLAESRQLWVDLGRLRENADNGGAIYPLRMNSCSQPWGYHPEYPNTKFELKKIRTWQDDFRDDWKQAKLLDGSDCVALDKLINTVDQENESHWKDGKNPASREQFRATLKAALERKVLFQLMKEFIIKDPKEYLRFFQRVGQGGVPLSEKDLTYSIIKTHFPEIRVAAEKIAKDKESGRMFDEVDLVLGVLRVAKALVEWETDHSWETFHRPNPTFVEKLKQERLAEPCSLFREMMGTGEDDASGYLDKLLRNVRNAIQYGADNKNGLPTMIMAELPCPLLEVLLLLTASRSYERLWDEGERKQLCRLVVYWLAFVTNGDKAAEAVFKKVVANRKEKGEAFTIDEQVLETWLDLWVVEFERENWAFSIATQKDLGEMKEQADPGPKEEDGYALHSHVIRFSKVDKNDRKPGDFLRSLFNSGIRNKRLKYVLMWLQREYLGESFKNYDPTLGNDDDFPVDLDHLVPASLFDFRWGNATCDESCAEDFRWNRFHIGNSLGNYRWLKSGDNRSRQDGPICTENEDEIRVAIQTSMLDRDELEKWNSLIEDVKYSHWGRNEILGFQRLIEKRALKLYENLLRESGLWDLAKASGIRDTQ